MQYIIKYQKFKRTISKTAGKRQTRLRAIFPILRKSEIQNPNFKLLKSALLVRIQTSFLKNDVLWHPLQINFGNTITQMIWVPAWLKWIPKYFALENRTEIFWDTSNVDILGYQKVKMFVLPNNILGYHKVEYSCYHMFYKKVFGNIVGFLKSGFIHKNASHDRQAYHF